MAFTNHTQKVLRCRTPGAFGEERVKIAHEGKVGHEDEFGLGAGFAAEVERGHEVGVPANEADEFIPAHFDFARLDFARRLIGELGDEAYLPTADTGDGAAKASSTGIPSASSRCATA